LVAALVAVTDVPGTAAPEGSVTRPEISPKVWAETDAAWVKSNRASTSVFMVFLFVER
jgi:hypothetical protein